MLVKCNVVVDSGDRFVKRFVIHILYVKMIHNNRNVPSVKKMGQSEELKKIAVMIAYRRNQIGRQIFV